MGLGTGEVGRLVLMETMWKKETSFFGRTAPLIRITEGYMGVEPGRSGAGDLGVSWRKGGLWGWKILSAGQ